MPTDAPGSMPDVVSRAMMPLHPGQIWIPTMEALFETLPPEQRPVRCVQRAGEALYLPAMWAHATINRVASIGAGGQAALRPMHNTGTDFFTHMARAAEAFFAEKPPAIDTAVSNYIEAVALAPRMVRAHLKLIEMLLISGAKDSPQSEARKRTEASINDAVATTVAAVETGATARVGAANLNLIATTLLDAAMLQSPPHWEPADAFDKCEVIYKQAAQLAARSDIPVEKLSGHISLQLGLLEFSRSEVPEKRLKRLQAAIEYLQDAV
jgi:hypothetical protein